MGWFEGVAVARVVGVRWRRAGVRSGWLLLVAVLLAVTGSVLGQLQGPLWALAILAGVTAAVPPVIEHLQSRRQRLASQGELLDRTARGLSSTGRLPLVRDVSLEDFGVHRAVVDVGYVPRDMEAAATEVLRQGRPLLVIGHSMAGKSRMTAELIRRLHPDAPIFLPDTGTALTELANTGGIPENAVVWLNELDEYLAASGLTVGLLERLLTGATRSRRPCGRPPTSSSSRPVT